MGESTSIGWCDATFNPWWGCERVSPGCAHCYADTFARRLGMDDLWAQEEHGFRFFKDATWAKPLRWAQLAREGRLPDGKENRDGHRPRIFCASMADVFEDRRELDGPRLRLLKLIEDTPELDWLVLTKRPEKARDELRMWNALRGPIPESGAAFADIGWVSRDGSDWACAPNLWMGVSIENARYTWRADVLREIPAAVRFISAEPLLGSLYDGRGYEEDRRLRGRADGAHGADAARVPILQEGHRGGLVASRTTGDGGGGADARGAAAPDPLAVEHEVAQSDARVARGRAPLDLTGIDWVILGGESGPRARPFHLEHAREIIDAAQQSCWGCRNLGNEVFSFGGAIGHADDEPCTKSAVFVKQLGAKPVGTLDPFFLPGWRNWPLKLRDRKGEDWAEWPVDLRIREFPRSAV